MHFPQVQNSFKAIAVLMLSLIFSANTRAASLYWIGGSGNWNSTAHWSATSGGASCNCTPTVNDNVYFDTNSFSASGQSVTINAIAYCDSMNWSAISYSNIMTGTFALHISGSLTLSSTLNVSNYTGAIYFDSNNIANKITSAGKTFATNIFFAGSGDWKLKDAFATTGNIALTNGTLNTGNQNFTCSLFSSTGNTVRLLILGTSLVTLTGNATAWNITGTNFAIDAGTSLLKFTNTYSYTYLTAGNNDVYYDVLFTDPNTSGYINGGSSTYHNVTINGGGTINPGAGSYFNDVSFNGAVAGNVSSGAGSIYHNVIFNSNGTVGVGTASTFNDVTFGGTASISTAGTAFNNVVFNGTATVSNTNGTFKKADFKTDASITSPNTFDTLLFAPAHTYTLTQNTTQTINNYFKAIGNCSQLITIHSNTAGSQATISKSSGAVTVSYATMKDIKAAGGATFTLNSSTDLGNNTGWAINTPSGQNLYWVGGTGSWSNASHWSTTSGGAPGGCIPTLYDNVYFDANSFSASGQSVLIDIVAYCDSMNWAGITNTNSMTGSADLHIYGSLRLNAGVGISSYTGNLSFHSASIATVIVSAGKTFSCPDIYFNGTGNWALLDAFASTGDVNLVNGSVNTGNNNFTCAAFNSTGSNVRSFILGSSTVTLTANGTAWNSTGSNFGLSSGTSLLKFTNTYSYTYLTAGNNDVYYDVLFTDPNTSGYINGGTSQFRNVTVNGGGTISPGAGSVFNDITFNGSVAGNVSSGAGSVHHNVVFGGNGTIGTGAASSFNNVTFGANATLSTSGTTFNNVLFNGPASVSNANGSYKKADFRNDANITTNNTYDTLLLAGSHNYVLTYNTVQTVNNYLKAIGTCSQPISLQSNTVGSQATISKASGIVSVSYVRMKDIKATGGATFNAASITDLGNNTGWTLTTPVGQNLYWVGGTGNWSNSAHWSATSGGAPGACIPTLYDNVYFDVNSFTASGQSVTIDIVAYCDSMNWTGITNSNILTGASALNIYGSLRLAAGTNIASYSGNFNFKSTNPGNVIFTAGKTFPTHVYFDGSGDWTLRDAFTTSATIFLSSGTLVSNNKNISCSIFNSSGSDVRALLLGSSVVTMSANGTAWTSTGTNFALDAGTSLLRFTNTYSYTYLTAGANDVYYDVIFVDTNTGGYINGGTSTFHNVIINGGGTINPGTGSFFNNVTFNGVDPGTISSGNASVYNNVIFNGTGTVSPGAASSFNKITFNSTATINTTSGIFHEVIFNSAANVSNAGGTFGKANFKSDGNITASASFDTLLFAAGRTYKLTTNTIQTINYYLKAEGTCTQHTILQTNSAGSQAYISKSWGTVTVGYIDMRDINATGGAVFNAASSTNVSNNSGWNFSSATLQATFIHAQNSLAVSFTNTSQFATAYHWSFGDGDTSLLESPVHTYTTPGNYTVCLIAADVCGNSDTLCTSLTVCSPLATGFTYTVSGQSVTFTNISQNANNYLWNFGDGNTSTQASPVHTYFLGGGYNVILIASNSCGDADTIHQLISVNCTPPVAGYAASATGNMVSFVNSSTNAANILWTYGDGATSTAFTSPHTYYNGGTYNICLIATNGCGSDTICHNVVVTCVTPTAAYNYAVSGMTTNFTNTSVNSALAHWDFGDGQSSTQNNPAHTYQNAGTYNVKLKVNNGCGVDSITQAVTIICAQPVASFATSQQGLMVDFVSTSANASSVQWNFGDATGISILSVVNHTYASNGTYNVCLTATNGCGTNTVCQQMQVCTPPVANFSSSVSALTLTLTNTTTNGSTYMWDFGDGNGSNLSNPTHVYTTAGVHSVCLIAANSCGNNQNCKNVSTSCTSTNTQLICMVTVDAASTHNIIVWEKPVATDIDSFRIYREDQTNVYTHIGTVAYDSLSEYHDHGANPNVTSKRYKMSIVDTCGVETAKSPYHNTIYISSSNNGQYSWNPLYTIENSPNPVTNYILMRDDNGSGVWNQIATTAGTQFTLNDPAAAQYPNGLWRVETQWSLSCTSTRGAINTSRSNIKTATFIGINDVAGVAGSIVAYPNPFAGSIVFEMSNTNGTAYTIELTDALGRVVKAVRTTSAKTNIDTNELSTGVYFYRVIGTDLLKSGKVIKD